jgi:tetratricopeptide (TPR) repeat protein
VLVAAAGGGFLIMRRMGAPGAQPAAAVPSPSPPAAAVVAPPLVDAAAVAVGEAAPAVVPARAPAQEPPVEKAAEPEKPRHERKPRHEKKIAGDAPSKAARNEEPLPPAEAPKPQGSPAQLAYKEGLALFDQGNPRGAIGKLQEAVRLDGGNADAYKALGRAYNRIGESDAAKKSYRRYLELRPDAKDRVFIQSIIGDR